MKSRRFGLFGVLLLAIFIAVFVWQNPGTVRGKLTHDEINRYVATVERSLPMPAEEKPRVVAHLRAWAEADDGKPVVMLNLMRYHEKLRTFDGAPAFSGTPRESNQLYEDKVAPLLLKVGGYPLYAGETQGKNLMGFGPGQDGWGRVLLVRYPSRRAFLSLVTDPSYGPIEPYKLMGLEVVLSPTSPELILPDLWLATGAALMMLFLGLGWWRALDRRAKY